MVQSYGTPADESSKEEKHRNTYLERSIHKANEAGVLDSDSDEPGRSRAEEEGRCQGRLQGARDASVVRLDRVHAPTAQRTYAAGAACSGTVPLQTPPPHHPPTTSSPVQAADILEARGIIKVPDNNWVSRTLEYFRKYIAKDPAAAILATVPRGQAQVRAAVTPLQIARYFYKLGLLMEEKKFRAVTPPPSPPYQLRHTHVCRLSAGTRRDGVAIMATASKE